jgi:hypothetical protein
MMKYLFRQCRHLRTRCIHGDEGWARMTWWRGIVRRQACLDCGRALNRGPICTRFGRCYHEGEWIDDATDHEVAEMVRQAIWEVEG